MPENLRALAYVLILAVPVLYLAKVLAVPLVDRHEFRLWRNMWLATTCLAFTVPSFLLFALLLAAFSYFAVRRMNEPWWLYLVLMIAAPCVAIGVGIPGVFNRIIDLSYPRLLALLFLLPAAVSLYRIPENRILRGVDWPLVGFWLLQTLLALRHGDLPSILRVVPGYGLDILLPYFVFSRVIRNSKDFNRGLLALVVAAMPLAAVGVFELWRDWRIYYVVVREWDIVLTTPYLFRDGLLRAAGTSIEPIAFGFLCMSAAASFIALPIGSVLRCWRWLALMVLIAGLYASVSRGPWLGFAIAIVVTLLTNPPRFARLLVPGIAGFVVALQLLPAALIARFVNLLPFVGAADQGSETYRELLFEKSLLVIERNLLFGSKDFIAAPELQSLIQGQGIIDVVNTYLQVTLEFGVLGLCLFVSIFALLGVQLAVLWASDRQGIIHYQAIAGLYVAILFTIATTSSVTIIPVIYWLFAGLLSGLVRARLCTTELGASAISVAGALSDPTARSSGSSVGIRVLGRGI